MKILERYLEKIQSESVYGNPVQTRPKANSGITKQKSDTDYPPGVKGPSGIQVDLDKDEEDEISLFHNFTKSGDSMEG